MMKLRIDLITGSGYQDAFRLQGDGDDFLKLQAKSVLGSAGWQPIEISGFTLCPENS